LHEALARQLGGQIRRGLLRPGERLPSLRETGRRQRVSISTAVEAYQDLEREGLVEARERSGYYVRAPASDVPAGDRAIRLQARTPQALRNPALLGVLDVLSRSDLLPMHATSPAPALLPGVALGVAAATIARRHPDSLLKYSTPQGEPVLRDQVVRRYLRCGVEVERDEVVVTAGAMEAMSLALRCVTRAGDVVLVETPTYYGILQAVAALGLRVIEIPNRSAHGIDVAGLAHLLDRHAVRAAVLVPNINNPTGSITPDATKRELVDACARRGVVVIEDDLYGELAFTGERPLPLRAFDRQGTVITCGSFSKILAPGLRVGWALGAGRTAELVRAKCFSTLATATLPQLTIAHYLARHDFDRVLRKLRRELATNAQRCRALILRHWPERTRVSEPLGGMALWLELPEPLSGQSLFEAAVAQGIGCLPGHLFSSRGDYRGHLRIGYGLRWDERVEQGVLELGRLATRLLRAA
jgi:DNA-binding transcriptional MocR family regulator